jgi:hypothetical protein
MAEKQCTERSEQDRQVLDRAVDALWKIYRLASRADEDVLERRGGDAHIFCEVIRELAVEHGHALDHQLKLGFGVFDSLFDDDEECEAANG